MIYRTECGCICSPDIDDLEGPAALAWAEEKMEHERSCSCFDNDGHLLTIQESPEINGGLY